MSTAYYRIYDLPWTPSEADERRVRRVLGAVLGLFIGFGVIIPLLPERERAHTAPPAVPDRVVEFLLERPKPKPEPKVVEVPEPPKHVIQPQVEQRVREPAPAGHFTAGPNVVPDVDRHQRARVVLVDHHGEPVGQGEGLGGDGQRLGGGRGRQEQRGEEEGFHGLKMPRRAGEG